MAGEAAKLVKKKGNKQEVGVNNNENKGKRTERKLHMFINITYSIFGFHVMSKQSIIMLLLVSLHEEMFTM